MARDGAQKKDKAQEICLAAAEIFFAKGYNATSLNDIADALNITKPALYYYFASKQDLLYRIITMGLDNVREEVLDPAREITDPEERLRFIIRNHARLSAGGNHAVIIISHEDNELSFQQREEMLRRRREYFDFIRDTLAELKEAGKLRDVDLTTATFTILGMIIWLSRWYSPNGKMSVDEVCKNVSDMALNGIMKHGLG
ncbi:MAG: TetR/AcrR family transcriptional regulator [Pyrinomonadaceae bacterium]